MRSSDTLLQYVFNFVKAHNKISGEKISPLQALRIYHEITKAGN